MSSFDLDHPFFLPLWRRIVLTAFCIGWTIWELVDGSLFWAILFGAAAAYCVWGFFYAWDEEAVRAKRDRRN